VRAAAGGALGIAVLAACGGAGEAPAGKRAGRLELPVDVAPLVPRRVQYVVTAPGSLDAFQEIQITARVAGAVDRVAFVEGQAVRRGDVLAAIERERYELAVEQARSALGRAEAVRRAAEAAVERRLAATRSSPGLVPGEELEQRRAAADMAGADAEAARSALRLAELDLRESWVRAPIAGVVQTRTVQQGQYLPRGAVLATILQRDPLLLRFQVSVQDALRLAPGMVATLALQEAPRGLTATISLVAGAADRATRRVGVTAQVAAEPGAEADTEEPGRWLRPGAFCQVAVSVGDLREALVVPSLAVQQTERGNIVYVVGGDRIARARVVELGMHTPDGGVELTHGVMAGELLVIHGLEPLGDGAPVRIVDRLSLEAAGAP
jgi:RND family efflux transporter MFP subunit